MARERFAQAIRREIPIRAVCKQFGTSPSLQMRISVQQPLSEVAALSSNLCWQTPSKSIMLCCCCIPDDKEKRMKGIVTTIVTTLAGILLLLGLGGQMVAPLTAAAQEEAVAKTNLRVGDTAPDFSLLSDKWEQVKLSDYRGKKNVILAFYVLAFTGG
jgi:hypothetical protein